MKWIFRLMKSVFCAMPSQPKEFCHLGCKLNFFIKSDVMKLLWATLSIGMLMQIFFPQKTILTMSVSLKVNESSRSGADKADIIVAEDDTNMWAIVASFREREAASTFFSGSLS